MDTLSKYLCAQWRGALRNLILLAIASAACLFGAACQHGATHLDRTEYDRQIRDADGFLFESYSRYIVMQFTDRRWTA